MPAGAGPFPIATGSHGLSTPWVNELGGAKQIVLDNWWGIGVLTDGGDALVKNGDLGAVWVNELSGAKQVEVVTELW
ncbi:hypothetical protein [Embleya sp. NPDC020630]|uniref:hypothetical protein n=1 Tax=Embleya sp. NPDC020630 TaxID=3363979 RepID=UPI00379D0EF9